MATIPKELLVDSVSLQVIADYIGRAGDTLSTAGKRIDQARRHQNWRCNEKHRITDEVDILTGSSARIAKFLAELSSTIRQGANEFDMKQAEIISGTASQNLKVDL